MADGREPICQAMIFCDSIYVDPWSEKRTFLGVFTSYGYDQFPLVVPELAIHIVLTECVGAIPIRVRVVDMADEQKSLAEAVDMIESRDPLLVFEIDVRFPRVRFERPGIYLVQLLANETLIFDRRLRVDFVSPEGSNGT
jgi:hypothetical protein